MSEQTRALREIEWVRLVFPDVNVLVNVPEIMRSHFLRTKFRRHGTNRCKQKLSSAIFVGGDTARSVKETRQNRSK